MLSKLKEKLGGAAIGAVIAAVAVAGALAVSATAQQGAAEQGASASHGAVKHVKRALRISYTANRRAVQAIRAARRAQQPGGQGADIYFNFLTGSVASGEVQYFEVDCDPGDMPFSGTGDWIGDVSATAAADLHLVQSAAGAHGWVVAVYNGTGASREFRAHAACLRGGRDFG